MNAAAEIIHAVAHPDANIIFGAVIDDEMGDEVKVTVIAAGFDRWDSTGGSASSGSGRQSPKLVPSPKSGSGLKDLFADGKDDPLDGDDDFDVPSFLK